MNKFKTLALAICLSFVASVASAEVRMGVSVHAMMLESSGSETLRQSSNVTNHTEKETAIVPSLFIAISILLIRSEGGNFSKIISATARGDFFNFFDNTRHRFVEKSPWLIILGLSMTIIDESVKSVICLTTEKSNSVRCAFTRLQ